jgi:hypothetical protein
LWEWLPAAINDGSTVLLRYSRLEAAPTGKICILVIKIRVQRARLWFAPWKGALHDSALLNIHTVTGRADYL